MARQITIATRSSALALWQANYVKASLEKVGIHARLLELVSSGDKILDSSRATLGGKGLFLKELEQALQNKTADIAVHSMKDVPNQLPPGLCIAAICKRADARDAVISKDRGGLKKLKTGAVVGTSSLRRVSQLRAEFPHLNFAEVRGNINTRLEKLSSAEFDALILAAAGLQRLQLTNNISEYLSAEICLPAVGQGAIGIECRADDTATRKLIADLNHDESAICVSTERATSEVLGGDCNLPLAVYASIADAQIKVRAMVGARDGSRIIKFQKSGVVGNALDIGREVGEELLAQGAHDLLGEVL